MAPSFPFSLLKPAATVFLAAFCAVSAGAWGVGGFSAIAPSVPGEEKKPVEKEPPVEVDDAAIRKEQNRILREQQAGASEALYAKRNAFTDALDRWHAATYRWFDNTVRWVDLYFALSGREYEHELSSCAVSVLARAGGRGDDGDFDVKVRFRASVALPSLEERVHVVVDNLGRDNLPDSDPMKREDDLRIGLHSSWESLPEVGGGMRWHNGGPVGYVDVEWPFSFDLAGGDFRFLPRGFWYTDDGFGQNVSVSWTSDRNKHTVWQLISAETSRETFSGFHLEETLRVAFPHHAKGCGWVFQASVFPHLKDHGRNYADDFLVNVTWRDALYRKWMYYTITPQVDFADEDGHDPHPSLRIGLEILFGRETRDLI